MYKQIVVLLALAAVSYAQVVGWTDCGSTGIIHAIHAGPCTSLPCAFVRGNTYEILFTSTAASPASSLPYNVTATILGAPWVVMEGNGCDQLQCPTAAGQLLSFVYSYVVSTIFPPVPSTIQTVVQNHLGETVICFSFPIQIV